MDNFHAYKYELKKDKDSSMWGINSGTSQRTQIRKRKKELAQFAIKIKNKIWWRSLKFGDQGAVLHLWQSSDKKSPISESDLCDFIKLMEVKFPGEVDKKRDLILEEILK